MCKNLKRNRKTVRENKSFYSKKIKKERNIRKNYSENSLQKDNKLQSNEIKEREKKEQNFEVLINEEEFLLSFNSESKNPQGLTKEQKENVFNSHILSEIRKERKEYFFINCHMCRKVTQLCKTLTCSKEECKESYCFRCIKKYYVRNFNITK